MQRLRWNNAKPIQGHDTNQRFHNCQGLDVAEISPPSGRGRSMEEALYDSATLRQFVGIDLGAEPVPDETTV